MEHDSRKQRVIFTFTSGLDEQIRLKKSWAKNIFNDEKLSFLLVFIKSQQLNETESEYLQSVWKEFETETKTNYGAKSTLKLFQ
ncbi:hypothetical protein M9Y10_028911 [Tritrichomonas musculus]|uniref:Uncharacterized protein n=1 Tax=Tritrichomonas musculus TaxID=1915356 RepID=A0ABR2KLI5_9EUKA